MNHRRIAYGCWIGGAVLLLVSFVIARGGGSAAERAEHHIGDVDSKVDQELYDPRFPEMEHWAAAGVLGGIPHRSSAVVREEVKPGGDIQGAVNRAADAGGGVVQLAPGRYVLSVPIVMQSGVILRGSGPDHTRIAVDLRSTYLTPIRDFAIQIEDCERVGIEDLSITHPVVEAIPVEQYRLKYANDINGRDDLRTGLIGIRLSKNCWVQNCLLTASGSSPVLIVSSQHITMRFNVVDGSYNKGGRGNGYYLIAGSRYVLCANETVRNLRHFSIQDKSMFCVVIGCRFETDLNFHGFDWGRNLVESCEFAVPGKHQWSAIAWWKAPRGDRNFIYRPSGGKGNHDNLMKGVPTDPDMLYEVLPTNEINPIVAVRPDGIPEYKTLFARTGHRAMSAPSNK